MQKERFLVIYLARVEGGGWSSIQEFLTNQKHNLAHSDCGVAIVMKGRMTYEQRSWIQQQAKVCAATCYDLPDDGLDWGAYIRIAKMVNYEWLLLLNTHSRPQSDLWLTYYKEMLVDDDPKLGAVAASASYESHLPTWNRPLTKQTIMGLVAQMLWRVVSYWPKKLLYKQHFAAFPNPHLRSNALMLRRRNFLEFISRSDFPQSKQDVLKMESGLFGLSQFLKNQGLSLKILGKHGQTWDITQAHTSETFRLGNQRNLLISDNQTRFYQNASDALRRNLRIITWGEEASQFHAGDLK
jgi:hypothetical protein